MLQSLRTIRSAFTPGNRNLIPSQTIHPFSAHPHRPKSKSPPPPDESEISAIISSLPPRFTPSQLSAAISNLSNPLLCLPLLRSTLRRPNLLPLSPSPFLAAVTLLGNSRLYAQMDAVASLAFSFPSLPLPAPFFNSLIRFYSHARWIPKAIGVYKIINSHSSSSSSAYARPNRLTFNLLFAAILSHRGANSYVHHLYMGPLRSLFRQMLASGVRPDVRSLNLMIKGYVLSMHLNDALRLFHQMEGVYGVEPDGRTYGYLVHGLCCQGRTRNAVEMLGEARGRGVVVTGRAWNSMVCALAMEGEVGEAVGVMWEGVGRRRWPDFVTCRTVVEEVGRRGGTGEAAGLLREMRGKGVVDGRWYDVIFKGLEEDYGD